MSKTKPSLEATLNSIGEERFHIHADLFGLQKNIRSELEEKGFYDTSFSGYPEGFTPQIPPIMYTFKTSNPHLFSDKWAVLIDILERGTVEGYAEGEEIMRAAQIPYRDFTGAKVPFKIYTKTLEPDREFRETEFHLEFDSDCSNQGLVRGLLEAGLYGGYYNEPSGNKSLTLTMQGNLGNVRSLMEGLRGYLEENGGLVNARIAEEVALRHKLFGINRLDLPKVVDRIEYF